MVVTQGGAFVGSHVKNRISFLPPRDLNSSLTSVFSCLALGNGLWARGQ